MPKCPLPGTAKISVLVHSSEAGTATRRMTLGQLFEKVRVKQGLGSGTAHVPRQGSLGVQDGAGGVREMKRLPSAPSPGLPVKASLISVIRSLEG